MTDEQAEVFKSIIAHIRAAAEKGIPVVFGPEEAGAVADIFEGILIKRGDPS